MKKLKEKIQKALWIIGFWLVFAIVIVVSVLGIANKMGFRFMIKL